MDIMKELIDLYLEQLGVVATVETEEVHEADRKVANVN